MSDIREVKQLPLTLLLFFTVHQKSTHQQTTKDVQENPKNRSSVRKKKMMDRSLNEHNQNLAGILTNSWEQQSSHFGKMDHPKILLPIDSLPAPFFPVGFGEDLLRI